MILEFLYGLLFVAYLLICAGAVVNVRRFLHETPTIADQACIERFKNVARVDMYGALSLLVIMVPGTLVSFLMGLSRGLPAVALIVISNLGLFALSRHLKKIQEQSRSLPVINSLAEEYHRVSETWLKRALPDF